MNTEFDYRKKEETLTTGSIIHWSERAGRDVPVTCGKCKHKRLVQIPHGVKKLNFTGLCAGHKKVRFSSDEKLPSGSIIHWGNQDRKNKKVWFTCTCGEKWLRRIQRIERRKAWTFCRECMGKAFSRPEERPSGTIIYWNKRDPKERMKVAIFCRGCKKMGFTWSHNTRRESWTELCPECMRQSCTYNKLLGEKHLISGSIIYWEIASEDGKHVKVTCGACEKDWWPLRTHAVSRNRVEKWTGFCPKCLRNPATLSQRLLEKASRSKSNNASQQQNEPAEKSVRGRKPSTSLDYEKLVADVRQTVLKLKDKGISRSEITSNRVASILHIGSQEKGGDTMMKRLRKGEMTGKWQTYRDAILDREETTISAITAAGGRRV